MHHSCRIRIHTCGTFAVESEGVCVDGEKHLLERAAVPHGLVETVGEHDLPPVFGAACVRACVLTARRKNESSQVAEQRDVDDPIVHVQRGAQSEIVLLPSVHTLTGPETQARTR